MKIRKMTATFGKLKNASLTLGDGLNIISAPNEFGKSTWSAFIRVMLYGIDTSKRDKAGYLSDKTRYRPWDGGAMEGEMDILSGGREITLRRTHQGSAPMRAFSAVYTGTLEPVRSLTGSDVGEKLSGVPEHIFERTAFIRRPDMKIGQTAELEKRISSLVSSGDEHSSYSEADSLLRLWQRKLNYQNRTGSIPETQAALREEEAKAQSIHRMADGLSDIRDTLARLEHQKQLLLNDLTLHDRIDRRAKVRKITEAKKDAERCKARVDGIVASITKNGHTITREDITVIRNSAASIEPLTSVKNSALKSAWAAETEYAAASRLVSSSPLASFDESLVIQEANEAKRLEEEIQNRKTHLLPPAVCWSLTALFAALSAVFFMHLKNIALGAVFGGFSLIFAVLNFVKPKKDDAPERLAAILKKYGVPSPKSLSEAANEYSRLIRAKEAAKVKKDASSKALEDADAALSQTTLEANRRIAQFMPEGVNFEDALEALSFAEKQLDLLTHANFDMLSAESVYESLKSGYSGDYSEADEFITVPLRDREDTNAALKRVTDQLSEVYKTYNLAQGQHRALGDPVVIETRIESLREKLAADTEKYEALSMAIAALQDANAHLETRFSPIISRRAGEILSRLTGGKYEKIVFDRDFNAGVKAAEDAAHREIISLSDGTVDEAYLSLRLAMCELIFPKEDPCPIILDDALANFDDVRMARALNLLSEMAKKRQVILFTCHEREALFAKENLNATVITA